MADYPSAESVLVTALKAAFPAVRVATETPANLADVLPCVRVTRFGGSEDEVWTFDNASVDFDCFAADRESARLLGEQVRVWVRRTLPGLTVAGAFVARTRTISGPVWTPYDNTDLRRVTYSASIRLHALGVS